MPERLTIDDLEFELRRSSERETVGLTVERDGSLIARAPAECPVETVEDVVRSRRVWIHQKLARKEHLNRSSVDKEYVPGESFYYLGRTHRLEIVEDPKLPPLRLYRGRFQLRDDARKLGRRHFVDWYIAHATPWLNERCQKFAGRMRVEPEEIKVRDLGYRWGSCGDRQVHFHWRTILLPPRIIDYVIVHEFAHVHEPNHGPEFWRRVEMVMPDYEKRKRWLAENGARFDC